MSLPRMSWHIGDYKKDTGHLRAAGHGAYFLLIMHYWATGGLPNDDKQLAAIACMTDREWKQHRQTMAAFFGDGWTHKRINEELAGAQLKYEKRSNAGKKGGRPPKQTESNALSDQKQPITLADKEKDAAADARASAISEGAFKLADDLHTALGWERDDPRAIGSAYSAQKWLNGGWQADLCITAVRQVVSKSRKKINTLAYFEPAIAEAHARQDAPLPKAVIETSEVIHVEANQRHPGGAFGASKDRFREAFDELKAFNREQCGSDGDGKVVGLLRPLGRERA